MTLRQYWRHILSWLALFPRRNTYEHFTSGVAGSGRYVCIICGYVEVDEDELTEGEA